MVQDEEIFLYKPYNISSNHNRPKTPEPIFIKDEVKNLKKVLKILQWPTKIIPFLLLSHYKAVQWNGEQDIQY